MSKLWTVPDLWRGGECIVLGGGPSLASIDPALIAGRRAIAVNMAFARFPSSDVLFFGDCAFWTSHGRAVIDAGFDGLIVTTCRRQEGNERLHIVAREYGSTGISRDPSKLFWNYSSGACAIGLARHLGVRRIVLLGFDMRKVGARHNFHDEYEDRGKAFGPYPRFLRPFPDIARDLADEGVECVNATPGSDLTIFPVVTPEAALGCVPVDAT